MPKAEESQVIVEFTQHSLHALRAVNGAVEAGGECALENKPALEALLNSVAADRKTSGIKATASVWPGLANWHVSTDTEAMLDRSDEALRAIAAGLQKDPRSPLAYAVCNAGDGGKVTLDGTETWILAFTSRESMQGASSALSEHKVGADGAAPAAFAGIGAVSRSLRLEGKGGRVALWDLGNEGSTLILVTEKGAEAAVHSDVGMDSVYQAVQTVLKLKFRGAGARLFFNDGYDFTESGPKIGAAVGAALKEALSQLPPSASPPALACLSLTGRQAWFVREVAAAAGTSLWEPDLGALMAGLGLRFAADSVGASFSSASLGMFELLSGRMADRNEWFPEWVEAEAPYEEPESAPEPAEEPVEKPEPVVRPAAPAGRTKPSLSIETAAAPAGFPPKAQRPAVPPRPTTRAPVPFPASQAPSGRPSSPARPQAGQPGTAPSFSFPTPATPRQSPFPSPDFPTPLAAAPSPTSAPRQQSFSSPSFPTPSAPLPEPSGALPPMPGTPAPAPAARTAAPAGTPPQTPVTALPFEAVAKLRPIPVIAASPPSPPKSKVGFYVGILVTAALLFAAIAVVLEARLEKAKANDLEQQEALAHHVAEQRLKEAEKAALDEAERSRKALEAAIALTKKQTEDETRQKVAAEREAARLAALPGTLVVATEPAGASVSIDGAAPLKAPVKVGGVAPGSHRIQISLAGYEPVDLSSDIAGAKTTDLGSIKLQSIYGSLELTSSPDSIDFAVRAASDPTGKPVRSGKTPATVDGVARGDYTVTFSRPGCRDHVEKVSVEKGVKSPVGTKYLDGSLELTSDPSGASVSKDGTFLGTTPLVLHDLTPKLASFDLALPGYDSTPISCEIPEGQTLKFAAQLLRKDRIFKPDEVKTPPESYESPQPQLSANQRKTGADVLLSLVVRRDGSVANIQVVRSTDDDIARRCKMAVENWKFRPATAPDDRAVDATIQLPFKFPAAPQ
jgi:TonB family protein